MSQVEEKPELKIVKKRGQKSVEVIATINCSTTLRPISGKYRLFTTFYSIPRVKEEIVVSNGRFVVDKVLHKNDVGYTTIRVLGTFADEQGRLYYDEQIKAIDKLMLSRGWEKC